MKESLLSKLLEASKLKGKSSEASFLSESNLLDRLVLASTDIPMLNVLLGGALDAGIMPGVTTVVGDSRTFKTLLCVYMIAQFLKSDENAICIYLDCEKGASKNDFLRFGAPLDRIWHQQFVNIEEMKTLTSNYLEMFDKGQKVFFFIDSVSQIASLKEVNDAMEQSGAADLTRARELNSFFRIVGPVLNQKQFPMFVINSYYTAIGGNKYADVIIKGGKQIFLTSDAIWLVTRAKENDANKELAGFTFSYNIVKSRSVKEKAKIKLTVTFDKGIDKYSGLFDLAQEYGMITHTGAGWFKLASYVDVKGYDSDTKYRQAQIHNHDIYGFLLAEQGFKDFIYQKYSLDSGDIYTESEFDD